MKLSRAVLLGSALMLVRCSCQPPPAADAGYACMRDGDCAEGFFCLHSTCVENGTDGGGVPFDAGVLAGGLFFSSPSRTAVVDHCSQPLVFELHDDAGLTVVAPYDVKVSPSADSAMSFFADDACQAAVTQLSVLKGQSGGTFRFRASTPGATTVTLSSPPLDPASQLEGVADAGLDELFFTTTAPPLTLAGTCVGPFTVTLQDPAGVPDVIDGGVTLQATSMPAGLQTFADSACTMKAQPTIPSGSASATFWASAATGVDYLLTVDGTNILAATQDVPVAPLVRSGTCNMNAQQLMVSCAVDPPALDVSNTFLLYQATGAETLVERVETACILKGVDTIECARGSNGGNVSVTWQTVEMVGARVNTYETGCLKDGGLTTSLGLDASVPASSIFTLVQTNAHGTDPNANDFFSADNDGTTLTLRWEQQCSADNLFIQTVELPNASVTRVKTDLPAGMLTDSNGGLSAPNGGFFVLGTWRTDAPVGATSLVCDRYVRPVSSAPNTLLVSRGADTMDAQCSATNVTGYNLERVSLGANTKSQQLVVTMDAGTAVSLVDINPVDLTRTFALISGQSGGLGQAVGEGAFINLPDGGSLLGEISATLSFMSPTQLQVSRGSSFDTAVFTVYVVQLQP